MLRFTRYAPACGQPFCIRTAGALAKTDKIENYFGFIEPVSGAELLERGQKQAERLGAVLQQTEVTGIEYAAQGFTVKTADGVV